MSRNPCVDFLGNYQPSDETNRCCIPVEWARCIAPPTRSAQSPAHQHLVYGRRRDVQVLLHFGLRMWAPVDFAVVVNERQLLALLIGIGSLHRTR